MEQKQTRSQKNRVDFFPAIPQQAFRYFPTLNDQRQLTKDEKILRWIFHDSLQYTKYENDQINLFDNYLKQKKLSLDQFWDRSWKLRWLCSTNYKFEQTYTDILKYDRFRQQSVNLNYNTNVRRFLESGAFYISGRDAKYRPIIVFDIKKLLSLKSSELDLIQALTYFLNYVLDELLIPGQVQNWVTIIDNGKQGLMSFIGILNTAFSFLSSTYRSRAFAIFLVNCPTSVYYVWKIVKQFLDPTTVKKIHFFQGPKPQKLFEFTNPQQIEQRFRGNAKNRQRYWPYQQLNVYYVFSDCPVNLVSSKQYRKRFQINQLFKTHIKKSLIQHSNIISEKVPLVKSISKKPAQIQFFYEKIKQNLQITEENVQKISQEGLFCVSLCSQFKQVEQI